MISRDKSALLVASVNEICYLERSGGTIALYINIKLRKKDIMVLSQQ